MSAKVSRRAALAAGVIGGLTGAAAALTGAISGAAQPAAGERGERRELGKVRQLIPSVPTVKLAVEQSEPPNLIVTASGRVPTGGWINVALVRAVYDEPPADGIVDYFLLVTSPEGLATQIITDVSATNKWKAYTKHAPWLKGVRVHGGRGSVVKMLGGR